MLKDQLKLHFVVFIWGFTSILGVLITLPAVEVVFYRTLIAAITLVGVMLVLGKSFRIRPRAVVKLLLTGFLVGGHWILFFASAKVSTVSICLAGMSTVALFTSIFEPLIKKQPVKWYEMALGGTVIFGLYLIFHFEFNHLLGLLLALWSAALSAIFSILNSQFTKVHEPLTITFYEMVGACLVCILFFPIYSVYLSDHGQLVLALSLADFLYLSILAVVCTVYAFYVGVEIMKRLSAFQVNLTINLEPVYGIILAVMIFGEKEKMSPGFYYGALVILLSIFVYPLLNKFLPKWERYKAGVLKR